jgi:urease accessory protein UreF
MAEYEAKELQESYDEAKSGERIVSARGFGQVSVRFPNSREKQLGEIEYAKSFTDLIDTNMKTRAEMEDVLVKRGIWSEKEEQQLEKLHKNLSDVLEKVAKANSPKASEKARENASSIRKQIRDMQEKRDIYMSNTIEAKADDVRMGFLVSRVATHIETGERVWKDYNAFVDEKNQDGLYDIVLAFIAMVNGIPSSFLEQSLQGSEELVESGELGGE